MGGWRGGGGVGGRVGGEVGWGWGGGGGGRGNTSSFTSSNNMLQKDAEQDTPSQAFIVLENMLTTLVCTVFFFGFFAQHTAQGCLTFLEQFWNCG